MISIQVLILWISLFQHAMGFDEKKAVHHFVPTETGGYIDIAVSDSSDTANRDLIRSHLQHIAVKFKAGDFNIPMLVHGEIPAGVDAMKRLSKDIDYRFSTTSTGGRLTIKAARQEALSAVHDFLRYQIREHKTGDDPNGLVRPKQPVRPARPEMTSHR